jgi:hypothetical protein
MKLLVLVSLSILLSLLEIGATRSRSVAFGESATAAQNLQRFDGLAIDRGALLLARGCTQRRYRRPH